MRSTANSRSVLVVTLFVVALPLSGCYRNLASRMAGTVGCPADEIVVSKPSSVLSRTWTAECRGHRFVCSDTSTSQHSMNIMCAPEL
jgi:hypothetical protein